MTALFPFCQNGVPVSIRSRFDRTKNLILPLKMCRDHHWHWKNTKSKSESRRCQFCWYLTGILTIRLRDCSITRSLNVNDSSFKQAAVWSPWRDVTILITLRHDVITTSAKRQLPCASSRLWKKTATNEPPHKISNNVLCATSKDSDQPAHTRSLIRTFASRLNFLCVLCYWQNIIWSF